MGLLLQGACTDDSKDDAAAMGSLDKSALGLLDASVDSGPLLDTACRLDQRYRFTLSDTSGLYELTSDGLVRPIHGLSDGGSALGCGVMLPGCTGLADAGVTVGELSAALLASDVVAAFSDNPTPFGRLSRTDFQSWPDSYREIVREDGKRILVGRQCDEPGCTSVPPGLLNLPGLLSRATLAVEDAQRTGSCR